jgi:uncharacterized alkaline shock family protein YloU
MRIWHRLVILLGSLVSLALAFLSFSFVGQGPYWFTTFLIERIRPLYYLLTFVLFLVLFILLIAAAFHSRRIQRTVIHETALGEVQIAFSAIEDLAYRAVKRLKGVREASVTVKAESDGLEILIDATIMPDINIPQISEEIRSKVADYIRETTGIPVSRVIAMVAKISNESRPRVE